jgi:hypothetical protein
MADEIQTAAQPRTTDRSAVIEFRVERREPAAGTQTLAMGQA